MTAAAHAQVTLAIASAGSVFKADVYAPIRKAQMQTRFSGLMVLLACLYVGLLLGLTKYTSFEEQPDLQVQQYYQYLMHVNIMVRMIYRQQAVRDPGPPSNDKSNLTGAQQTANCHPILVSSPTRCLSALASL